MSRVIARWFIGTGMLIVLVALIIWQIASYSKTTEPDLIQAVKLNPPRNINEFHLTDHRLQAVSPRRFVNHWTFVFFGFTNCPDVCPATLAQLVRLNSLLKEKQGLDSQVQFYFISVDPRRDTIKQLGEYIAFFDSTFIAMTGDEQSLRRFENELGAFHRLEEKRPDGNYNVQHSADIFLIDPAGRLMAKFSPPMDVTLVVRQFDMLVQHYAQKVT